MLTASSMIARVLVLGLGLMVVGVAPLARAEPKATQRSAVAPAPSVRQQQQQQQQQQRALEDRHARAWALLAPGSRTRMLAAARTLATELDAHSVPATPFDAEASARRIH